MPRCSRHVLEILAFLLAAATPLAAQTSAGSSFTYQGMLSSDGLPASGVYDLRFSLWDAPGTGAPPAGGTQISGTICSDNVTVTDGLFTVQLDFGAVAFNGDARWVQVGVRTGGAIGNCDIGTYATLGPRQRLNPAPYALLALTARMIPGIDGNSLNAADGAPSDALIVDNAGNVGVGTAAPIAALHAVAPTPAGVALYGVNTAPSGESTGGAVQGITAQAQGFAFGGLNSNPLGSGLVVAGNNAPLSILGDGSGGALTGDKTGVFAGSVSGDVAQSLYCDQFGDVVRVAAWTGSQFAKIVGAGAVSTVVSDPQGQPVTMFCPESPEVLFTDYGQGRLKDGFARIELDPTFAKNVLIDETHPLRVFIQLEDNEQCTGVIVRNKTAAGFDVVELQGGRSSTPFQYQIICNRADEVHANGRVSRYSAARFPPAPPALPKHTLAAPSGGN